MTDAPKRGLFIRLTRLPIIRSLLHIKKHGNSRSGLFAQFRNGAFRFGMKDRFDDEIDFQWGETKYDCSFLDEKGGKYHRNNPDGSLTEFNPPALRMKTAVGILNDRFFFDVKKKWCLLKMKTAKDALDAEQLINNHLFSITRGVSAKARKKYIELTATDVVMEATYFPGTGPGDEA
jgi:hypothetical protein